MKPLQFTIEINAPHNIVWHILWSDETFRDWASCIDEGTYMVGELKEGNEIEFISGVGGYGVRSLVTKFIPGELVVLKQILDTKDSGEGVREEEWTGGEEIYSVTEHDNSTTLKVSIDTPLTQEETMNERIPLALERIKTLAEESN